MTIPLNRVVAFAGPYISVAAGGFATWLVAKVNVVGLPGLDENNLKTAIAGGITWLLVAGLAWAGHSKWLTGHQLQLQGEAPINAAAMTVAAAAPPVQPAVGAPASTNGNGFHTETANVIAEPELLEDGGADSVADQELPTDDEELASPPPPVAYRPVEAEVLS